MINILNKKESSLGELTKTIGTRKPNISQHLAILRYLRIVKTRKDNGEVFYKIIDSYINNIIQSAGIYVNKKNNKFTFFLSFLISLKIFSTFSKDQ